MRLITFSIMLVSSLIFATQWQSPEAVNGLDINGLNLNSDNTIMYGSKWHDGAWFGDCCYYIWNGSEWVWGDWVQGDVNTQSHYEDEPFVTYDGQHLYFDRYYVSDYTIYVADWNGSEFVNSSPLNSNINQNNPRFPSLTQDNQKLYFSKGTANGLKIYESIWNGSDWGTPTLLPSEVNEGGGYDRMHVTITPDGNEIYFTGAGSYVNKLAFSQKIGGMWQQWQYCDYNINPSSYPSISSPAFTYSSYSSQYMYFEKNVSGVHHFRSLRSPVAVEPASLGQIKANYAR
jgi:hypothetical protein